VPAIVIADLQPEVAEFYGSMIVLDDPRHARLRMIVQKAFTPKVVALVEAAVRSRAQGIVRRMVERHRMGAVTSCGRSPLRCRCRSSAR
jgi:cytochrome P450